MDKPIASIEICSSAVKMIIAYSMDNRIDIVYSVAKALPANAIRDGYIVDFETVSNIIRDLKVVSINATKSRFVIDEAVVVLPDVGLEVYQNNKVTNVISEQGKIDKIDITNSFSLIRKDRVNSNSEIVDIVPDFFTLEDGRSFESPPLGFISNTLSINAKAYTLPTKIVDGYRRVMIANGLKPQRYIVAAYGACQLLSNYQNVPNKYILIDMGASMTSVSLVSDGILFSSSLVDTGGNHLSQAIAQAFNLNVDSAEKIKVMYGFDDSIPDLGIPIFQSEGGDNRDAQRYFSVDLNLCITKYIIALADSIKRAIKVILTEQELQEEKELPLVVIGGASKLRGLERLLKSALSDHVNLVSSLSIGARDPHFITTLGGIAAFSKFQNEVYDDQIKVTSISRVAQPNSEEENKGE